MPSSDTPHVGRLIPRPYQQRIIDHAVLNNTLIVLPTGAGKTLIATELIRILSPPALFIVPTVLLVKQQSEAIGSNTNYKVAQLHGGKALPPSWHVVVATPACFHAAQSAHPSLAWARFRCVVFDEVHHALKKHPYRTLALSLKRCKHAFPRVIGLTASFTYALAQQRAASVLSTLCRELQFSSVQTAPAHELKSGGYHASSAGVTPSNAPALRRTIPANVLPLNQRQPHLMLQTFLHRCENKQATETALQLFDIVSSMERVIHARDASCDAQLRHVRNVRKWSSNTFKRAKRHAHECMRALLTQLCHWYEALRLLVVSWEEDEYAAVWFLKMMKCELVDAIHMWPSDCALQVHSFWNRVKAVRFDRLVQLRQVLLKQAAQCASHGVAFRGIIFVAQRVCTHVIQHYIESDEQLQAVFRCGCVYASSTAATPMLSVSKTTAARRIEAFRTGAINVLIATSVAEEGMDIPAANCVIRFDAVQSTVSYVQGRGRARLEGSAFVVLRESEAKSSARFAQVESEHMQLLAEVCSSSTEQDTFTKAT